MQTLILNHYPPVIKQVKELQQIAKAEDIEFSKLNASINRVIRNMFVFTADETGVQRFEKLLGIKPKPAKGLEDRKIYILSIMNRRKISLSELMAMLSSYCEGIKLINDIANMEMVVEMSVSEVSINTINDLLEETLPLNIYFHFSLKAVQARVAVLALHGVGGKLKIKPLLQNKIKTVGQSHIRVATFIGSAIKIEQLSNTGITREAENG